MSLQYSAIGWNPAKRSYDLYLVIGVASYLAVFAGATAILNPEATAETMLIRALGTCAFVLLNVILCIGPLARLNRSFLPLLYNRRHMGVTMFLLALGHGGLSLFQFHALGDVPPLVSLFSSNTRFNSVSQFPFQQLGFLALLILFVMAATSHDFWLRTLSAPVWKRIHMLVYVAYGLLVAHVMLGAIQSERSPVGPVVVGLGAAVVLSLHIATAMRERVVDEEPQPDGDRDGFVEVCAFDAIPENRAVVTCLGGERVAVFRYEGRVSAISNVCQHQNGPLGEGRIIDGCITCPWHGYQYLPETGSAPAPFTEKVPTYRTRVVNGRVLVHPEALPAGTRVEAARV